MEIGDICHVKKYNGEYWIGKITEIHTQIDDYIFITPIIYIRGIGINFAVYCESEMKLIDGEWWCKE